MMSFRKFAWNNRYSIGYVALSSFFLVMVVVVQSYRYDIFGTKLLLGWDSPGYVWLAQDLIRNGPSHMVRLWNFPQLYVQLLAFLGYLTGSVVMIERTLPLVFGILLICANYQVVLKVTDNVHVAGLAALLTVLSLNALRLLADLHRNLMALSLATTSFLLVPNLDNEKSFLNKNYLLFVVLLLVIAGTHFETYFVLSLSLVLYGLLTKSLKNIVMIVFACFIPIAILVLLFPVYFFGYASSAASFEQALTLADLVLWTGGSWVVSGFFIIAAFCLFFRLSKRDDKLVRLILSYFLVVASLALVVVLTHTLPVGFALRALLLLPIPILLALAIQVLVSSLSRVFLELKVFSAKSKHFLKISFRRLLLLLAVSILAASSVISFLQHVDIFLVPYVPLAGYHRLVAASTFLRNNGLSQPVVVYYGMPAIWHTSLYRNYLGAEIGEHFTYYGTIENLFRLIPSEPKFKENPSIMNVERYFSSLYYNELVGNWSGLIPTTYNHQSYIKDLEALAAHPILIIAPEFYNEEIPYYIKPFYKGEGIYIIPPHSILGIDEAVYGPLVAVHRNGTITQVRSEYLYLDPEDSSIVILRVNGSSGYESYNFTNIPSNWSFIRIEQGDDQSFPERNPKRPGGADALEGNDPADHIEVWSSPQGEGFYLDATSRKEGFTSLKVAGTTDFWGNLGLRYDLEGLWDFSEYPLMAIWVRASEKAAFSIALHDSAGETRTFWSIQQGIESATAEWKRLFIDFKNYSQQTPDFDITTVDFVDFYVSSDPGKEMSLWIDDLILDDFPDTEVNIYKARVLAEDTVVVYFASRVAT